MTTFDADALTADLTDDERRELAEIEARSRDRRLGWLLVVAGAIGFVAAVTLLLERIQLLADPSYVPSCSLNPVLSCGSVMVTEQARVFGFPNPVIGVAAFPVVVAVGAGVLAGAQYAAWFWRGLQLGVTLGAVFVGWLVWQSLYEIGALCPYCMVVWAVVIPLFWAVLRRNAEAGALGTGPGAQRVAAGLRSWSVLATALTFLLVVALVGVEFWDYWSTLL